MTNAQQDPRTVDHDGFVIGADRIGSFGQRPSVGGLGATVQQGERIGLIVGMDTVRATGGLLLHLIWLDEWLPDVTAPVSEADRDRAREAWEASVGNYAYAVPADGLIALDAWLPEPTTDR